MGQLYDEQSLDKMGGVQFINGNITIKKPTLDFYVYCLTTSLSERAVSEFGGTVVEITDSDRFLDVLMWEFGRSVLARDVKLAHGNVRYIGNNYSYHEDPSPLDIVFRKSESFAWQCEFRVVLESGQRPRDPIIMRVPKCQSLCRLLSDSEVSDVIASNSIPSLAD